MVFRRTAATAKQSNQAIVKASSSLLILHVTLPYVLHDLFTCIISDRLYMYGNRAIACMVIPIGQKWGASCIGCRLLRLPLSDLEVRGRPVSSGASI